MFETAETTSSLQTAQINSRVAEHFARRTSERARVKTVGKQVAVFGHDRHHGREVDVEAEHAQRFAGDTSERAGRGEIAVLADRARGGHRREDAAQAIHEPAFLVDTDE